MVASGKPFVGASAWFGGLAVAALLATAAPPAAASPAGAQGTPASEFQADDRVPAPTRIGSLESDILQVMATYHVPGVSACIIQGGRVAWSGDFGFADLERGVLTSSQTLFPVASISKPFVGAAILQLIEAGQCELDDDVNLHLPFSVRNPAFPDMPIKIRALLTHTSSIRDDWNTLQSLTTWGTDSPIALSAFCQGYLTPGGAYWSTGSFSPSAPGSQPEYSNIGIAVLGHVVEAIRGQSFASYTRDSLFTPLAMAGSGWLRGRLDSTRFAMPYYYWPPGGPFESYGYYGDPWYPSGQLRCTARGLARFLVAMMNGGVVDGARVLENESVVQTFTVHVPGFQPGIDMGLIWARGQWLGRTWWSHSGEYYGVRSRMRFDPVSGFGVIVLTNAESDTSIEQISQLLVAMPLAVDDEPGSSRETRPLLRLTSVTPHPIRRSADLGIRLERAGEVTVVAYDAHGRVAGSVVRSDLSRGYHSVHWDATTLRSGFYFLKVRIAGAEVSRRITVLH